MPIVNHATQVITCKIVYYGPAGAGKSSNVSYLYSALPTEEVGEFTSCATRADGVAFIADRRLGSLDVNLSCLRDLHATLVANGEGVIETLRLLAAQLFRHLGAAAGNVTEVEKLVFENHNFEMEHGVAPRAEPEA
ncbi:MAG: hypothetical protein M3Y64_10170 [Gemmatimonadota bacterium]|nr:hypothetical protein [Gemmatimonadota bacterium]